MKHSFDGKKSDEISETFSVAKLLAILLVLTGHYFEGSPLWVLVTIGLFVFSFSSGYFTAERYSGYFSIKKFWAGKLNRLLPPIMIVNSFLLLLFLWQGKVNVFHPHTIVAWFGLSGVLDWLSIKNESPFGNGLWFFTVLLIFYFSFPLINFLCVRERAWAFIVGFGLFCMAGHIYASPPYMLWLTVFGFGFGVFASRVNWYLSQFFAWAVLFLSGTIFLALNLYGYRYLNLLFVVFLSIAVVTILQNTFLHRKSIGFLGIWIPCVFEIYFVHTYLFVPRHWHGFLFGYLLSVLLVLTISYALAKLRVFLGANVYKIGIFY